MAQDEDPLGTIAKIDYDLACIERSSVGLMHAVCHRLIKLDRLVRHEEVLVDALARAWPVVKAQARAILIEQKDKVRAAGIATLREHLEKLEKGL